MSTAALATGPSAVETISMLAVTGLIVLGCGAALATLIRHELRTRRFLARAVPATGPVEILASDAKGMTVRFTTPEGEVVTRLPKKRSNGVKGGGVPLKYDPADPAKAMIATEETFGFVGWLVLLLIFGLPGAFSLYEFIDYLPF